MTSKYGSIVLDFLVHTIYEITLIFYCKPSTDEKSRPRRDLVKFVVAKLNLIIF